MDFIFKTALGGAAALAGFTGVKKLQKQAVQQYRTEGLRTQLLKIQETLLINLQNKQESSQTLRLILVLQALVILIQQKKLSL
jgi:hypothetical protein